MNIEKIKIILPSKIRMFRNSIGMTQEILAEKIEAHPTYVSRIESGNKLPSLSIICRIADVFKIKPYELLLDEEAEGSFDYKRKKLVSIVSESKASDVAIYSVLLEALHKRHKR